MNSTKPTLVYAGHSYHQLTSSTKFLLDLLESEYTLHVVWDESWQPSGAPLTAAQINILNPDVVLFFQTVPPAAELSRLNCKRLFLVPMHDHVVGNPRGIWKEVRASGLRVLNFCRATHKIFTDLGYESRCVQYWQAPRSDPPQGSHDLKIFFWIRRREIGWPMLKRLLGRHRPKRIILRAAADPGEPIALPTPEEIAEYNIEIVSGWLEKTRYLELLTDCNVFVAPRLAEGIGQSFLEAMSYGMAVIAPDCPTMNEYIRHDRNGYLYRFDAPHELNFDNLHNVRAHSLEDARRGYAKWIVQQQGVLDYIASPTPPQTAFLLRVRRVLSALLARSK